MTPQERQLIDELFERLARVENAPRDREAAAAIAEGLRYAPNAVYTLVQTVLLQDEALKRADARIKELEAGPAPQQPEHGSFLDTMRSTLFGGGEQPRSSVPNVRPNDGGRPAWNTGQVLPQGGPQGGMGQGGLGQGGFGQGAGPFGQQAAGGGGGSFLGTAAAAAAGVIGGSLLLSSIRGMMGGGEGGHQQSFGDAQAGGGGPWGSSSGSGGDLARDAGLNDIGSSGGRGGEESSRAGLLDQGSHDQGSYDQASYDQDPGFDDFDDGGDSDYA